MSDTSSAYAMNILGAGTLRVTEMHRHGISPVACTSCHMNYLSLNTIQQQTKNLSSNSKPSTESFPWEWCGPRYRTLQRNWVTSKSRLIPCPYSPSHGYSQQLFQLSGKDDKQTEKVGTNSGKQQENLHIPWTFSPYMWRNASSLTNCIMILFFF